MKTNDWRHLIRYYARMVTERTDLQEDEVFKYVMARLKKVWSFMLKLREIL